MASLFFFVVVARAVAIMSVAVLGLALVHKLRLLVSGRSGDVPALNFRWIPRSVTPLLVALAGLAEAALVVAVFVAPEVGLVGLALLLSGYSVLLRRQAAGVDCQCFGSALPATNGLAFARNVVLAVFAVGAALVGRLHPLQPHLLTQESIGSALIGLAVLAGVSHAVGRSAPVADGPGSPSSLARGEVNVGQ